MIGTAFLATVMMMWVAGIGGMTLAYIKAN